MAPKQNDREARQARERLRAYQARQTVHEHKVKRRKRDNWVAGIAAIVIVALAVGTQLLYFSAGPGAAKASSSSSPSTSPSAGGVPPKTLAEDRTWTGTMTINGVPLGVSLDGAAAPQAVSSTVSLVQKKFYDGLTCHRLTNGGFYVLQCGDPKGDGSGGPGYEYGPIENAPADDVYKAGTIAMARQGNNAESQGSQFFIVYEDTKIPSDDAGGYTVIGSVTSGLDQLKAQVTDKGIEGGKTDGTPAVKTTIDSFTLQ
ncbi:peptidyl-prolyl cis-trans isomerase B (cyclophilin B) [Leifsonia sp. 98AMF]|uniref:peptidylprolyl isomerase n=1 Tax=unclassified Leifsonia TaxID=2663824 RepID=UPI00087D8F9E|nr:MULTISPECIES: peptidylprolyl isomerase [unclassified Leifsonia]SDH39809.1 peptidyl-prolyl cis-trans isomerase B (cyclophilin B) [Leifsonia sp. 197AMF]SDI96653.1 peptidyl-prolyl cis-trans isomerase B (cyclophilin B) [Leifsonia sp. 466MF]SDJ79308.1 peptidyl-prolyl cis-trans isomerase B (cyclophilin B) [Leifsonia sp. 157MF]SDN99948.1 peptidyl-prolyl cis-trans isomerase B (cyclophilin B) [Leifsonia sp. 509MF]SEN04405.1 peptidyl-prolyl cis-trans isomerase B (cyclophilin B) [Leifsonia sp. 467MF]